MLKTKDLIEGVDEKFVPMLKEVNIPDFTKCIATFTWRNIEEVNDRMIKEYLLLWAAEKYKFYQMLGNKTRVDCPLTYKRLKDETVMRMGDLTKEFPAYHPWLQKFKCVTSNKLTSREVGWEFGQWMEEAFPRFSWEGCSLTRFFKSYLMAPDELVNKLAQVFENNVIEATYTISIDPVDIMLASENPYNWSSCYKLDPQEEETHADGCLAALIDSSSLITYVWDKEGEFVLPYSNFKFKSTRYKKMRAWISIAPDFNAFYMNEIYPGKTTSYGEEFTKALRVIVERVISAYTQTEDRWIRTYKSLCNRKFPYGYSEFEEEDRTFVRAGCEKQVKAWTVYDQRIPCPCGCGLAMPGFYDGSTGIMDNTEYNGEGYGCQGIKESRYCSYYGDYCDCAYDEDCYDCCYWKNAHPVCSLDYDVDCECGEGRAEDGVVQACEENCCDCSMWQENCKHFGKE